MNRVEGLITVLDLGTDELRAGRSQMLMTAQFRFDGLDREVILPQAVAENLAQPVRENSSNLLPISSTAG